MPVSFDVESRLNRPEITRRVREYLGSGDTTPMRVDLDLTSECNYRCRHCGDLARGLLNRGGLSWTAINPLLDDLQRLGAHEVALIGGGEPTLSPHFVETVKGLRARGIGCGLVTNGSRLTSDMLEAMDAGCDWVRVSLDAGTAATYARVHKTGTEVTFEKVIANLRRMIERMGSRVGVAYLITPINAQELAVATALVKAIGAAYIRVRPMQHPITGAAIELPERLNLAREIELAKAHECDAFEVSLGETAWPAAQRSEAPQPKPYRRCHAQAFGVTIAGDGKVYACSKWRGQRFACIGDLHLDRLWDIWHGDRRRNAVAKLDPSKRCQNIYCHAHPLNESIESSTFS